MSLLWKRSPGCLSRNLGRPSKLQRRLPGKFVYRAARCPVFSLPLCAHIESRPSHHLYHRTYSKTLHMACSSVEVPYPVSDEPRSLTDDDFKFLMAYTGCYDRDVLQHRVLIVWREVKSKLWVFKCIQEFMFLHPRIEKHPRTKDVLKQYKDLELRSEATNGFLMEVGSCFGTDLRWLILQGIAPKDLIATDLTPDYWIFGKQLFDDTDRLEVVTAFGSMADESLVSEGDKDAPLNYMRAMVHNVWAGAVLHVLDKESIDKLLRNVHLLLRDGAFSLAPALGQILLGPGVSTPDGKSSRYIHSPASLAAALEEAGFSEVQVELRARDVDPTDPNAVWSLKGLRKVGLMYYSATKPSSIAIATFHANEVYLCPLSQKESARRENCGKRQQYERTQNSHRALSDSLRGSSSHGKV